VSVDVHVGRFASLGGVPVRVIARLEPVRARRAATAYDVALAEALVAPAGKPIDPGALRAVATFMAEEMDSLPPRLRILYEAGMATFRFYVRLRYLHSFCGLDLARRKAAVDAWAFGRISLLRQLFRPVRSTGLLAYYEHDGVAQALSPGPRPLAAAREAGLARLPGAHG